MKANYATTTLARMAAFAAIVLAMGHAQASIVIAGTRVVYPANESEVTLKLSNEGQNPALVQVWTDKGDPSLTPSEEGGPFLVTPPIARVDPQKSQTLRIAYTGMPLPQDRESVFWLNVLEIPPKPDADAADVNALQFAFRSRIKLFFRPAKLPGQPGEAPAQVAWRVVVKAGTQHLEVRNPSAYHVSFSTIDIGSGNARTSIDAGLMLAPGETRLLPMKGKAASSTEKVRYEAVNDYGGVISGEATLQQGES
ncbi:fimbria/pilus periplasmic chaperone [Achromobacter pestifer]|uniref:Putative fimbrial chaperone YadV n=1 Tax=Achromobacter pestifer TaxID=1353889 RepID=A0A6S6Z7B0_9BURK|nr:fimbria/pilus periplasmic chaperone [Achromobacter pestifer]CAB3653897.1 putative fimbrial chaperone YadV [Achromobacter pestifer]